MSNRWLIAVGAFVGILVIVGVVVGLSMSRQATPLAEDTPEGTVQRFLQAIEGEDLARAYGYLAAEAREKKSFEEFRRELSFRSRELEQKQVLLEKSRVFDGMAEVVITITEFRPSGPLTFQTSEYSFSSVFSLRRESGKWLISEANYPVFFPIPVKPLPPEPVR